MTHKLYLFNNTQQPGFGVCYSITDKGVVLGQHLCSHSGYMYTDLVHRGDRTKKIEEHFNHEPYEVIEVPDDEVRTHEGLQEAFLLNTEAYEREHLHATKERELYLKGWISTSKQLPPENLRVKLLGARVVEMEGIAAHIDNELMRGYFYQCGDTFGGMEHITHWKPLDEVNI